MGPLIDVVGATVVVLAALALVTRFPRRRPASLKERLWANVLRR